MAEQTGPSVTAMQARAAGLAARRSAAAESDDELARLVADAHASAVAGRARLDAIEREIEQAVAQQSALALDTAAGGLEFQRFLLAKHREIIGIVTDATEKGRTHRATLVALTARYSSPDSPLQ